MPFAPSERRRRLQEAAESELKDAAIIAAQRVERYEMAGYGTVSTYAKLLKETEVHNLLKETMAEEVATDEALSELAESAINLQAV